MEYFCQDGKILIFMRFLDSHKEPVLLIDDAIDSGWTLTISSALLRQSGSGIVYPATLTSTSVN